jgi:hypothetical protein
VTELEVTADDEAQESFARGIAGRPLVHVDRTRWRRSGFDAGGLIMAQGTPEEIAQVEGSYTGRFLKNVLVQ